MSLSSFVKFKHGSLYQIAILFATEPLVGSAIAKDMLPQFVQADRLTRRLTMKPGEVGNELRFLRIQMERDAKAFPTRHMQRQAQLFEHGDGHVERRVRCICIRHRLFPWQLEVFGSGGWSDTMACACPVGR